MIKSDTYKTMSMFPKRNKINLYNRLKLLLTTSITSFLKLYICTTGVEWPSGLRRWFKAPVSSGAWVRIPLVSNLFVFST